MLKVCSFSFNYHPGNKENKLSKKNLMRKTRIIMRILAYTDLYIEKELYNYSYEQLYDILRIYVFYDLHKKKLKVCAQI